MTCPDDEQLARFAAGRGLDEAGRGAIATHLDGCTECQAVVGALARQSAFLARSAETASTAREPPDAAPSLEPGARLGRYTIVRALGRGAMGRVFVGLDVDLDRQVAIKVLEGGPRRDLRAEAAALARLSHPNVVTIYEVDSGSVPFIAMELVDGMDLAAWLAAEPRREPLVVATLLAVGDGLVAVHARGLVHRDLKPENILVGRDGRARLTDFGLAACTPVEPGEVAGTPLYMAPEQRAGELLDERADQFAFAIVAWEALTGSRPGTPGGGVPPRRYAATLERALAPRPADRFPTTTALIAALRDAARPRARWHRAVLVAALVAIAAVLGVALWSGERDPCRDAGRTLDGMWNAATRSRLQQRFHDRDDRALATAGTTIVAAIDDHVAGWREARTRSCRDARADRAPQVASRIACLDARRADLVAVVAVLADGDRDVLMRAWDVVGGLRTVTSCEIVDDVARSASARREPVIGLLARASALERAGDLDAAAQLASTVRSDDGGDDLVAEHQLLLARLADARDAPADARRALDRAALVAERSNQRTLRARVLAARVQHEVSRRDDLEAAALAASFLEGMDGALADAHQDDVRATLLRALAAYRGLTGEYGRADAYLRDAELLALPVWSRAQLAQARCITLREAGRHADAVEKCTASVALVQALVGDRHPALAAARANQAAAAAASGDRVRAVALLESSIATMQATLGGDHLTTLTAQRNLAGMLASIDRRAEALRLMEDILVRYETKLGPRSTKVAALLVDMAESYTSVGKLDRAAELAARATARLRDLYPAGHPDLAMSRLAEAEIALERGDVASAEQAARDALGMFEATLGVRHERLVHALYFLVQLAERRGDRAGILDALRRALSLEHLAPDVELQLATELAHRLPRGGERRRLVERALALSEAVGGDPAQKAALEQLR